MDTENESKEFLVKTFKNSRELVKFVNEMKLTKEDIVQIYDYPSPFTLFFYM